MWKKHLITLSFIKIVCINYLNVCIHIHMQAVFMCVSLSCWPFTQTNPLSGKSADVCVSSHLVLSIAGEWPVGFACRCEMSCVVIVVVWLQASTQCHPQHTLRVSLYLLPLERRNWSIQNHVNIKRMCEEQKDGTSLKAGVRVTKGCKNGETRLMHNEILFKLWRPHE